MIRGEYGLKFILSEELNLEEDTLNENKQLIKSIIHDYSHLKHNAKGFWSTYNEHKAEWISHIEKDCGVNVSGWEVHHVNGIHPNSKSCEDIDNLAFVDIHSKITARYVDEIEKRIEAYIRNNVSPKDNKPLEIYYKLIADMNTFESLLYAYNRICDVKGLSPSSVFKFNLSKLNELRKLIPQICADVLTEMKQDKAYSNHILPFNNITGAQRLLTNEPPPEEK